MIHGILNVYKEQGWTSHDVVARLRTICGQKRIGHAGTLDPDAEGVLVVLFGNATRVSEMLTEREKAYRAVLLLGVETDTQDTSGTVVREESVEGITEAAVRAAAAAFVGTIEQIPPMYSALKVDGKKLYDLARKGQSVDRAPRSVTIYDLVIEQIDLPRVTFTVRCSKGTYIRTLCQDIGDRLGCGGTMEHLVRTESAGYPLEDSLRLAEIASLVKEGRLDTRVHPVEEVFADCPAAQTKPDADRLLYNGNLISAEEIEGSLPAAPRIRMRDSGGTFCGIYGCADPAEGCLPVRMFLPEERESAGRA